MKSRYAYQDVAAKQVLSNALNAKFLASVLAACPGSGKTTISHKIINQYIELHPNAKIIVLTEGQNVLKNQYLEELRSPNIKINFSYGAFGSNAQVQVGIPQSIKNLKWDSVDLLIVDEAHKFYFANTVRSIIQSLKPRHQVLMTGSPTRYNTHNQNNGKKYGIYYISASDLMDLGVFSAVDMDVCRVMSSNIAESINLVLKKAIANKDSLNKIMMACSSIKEAKAVAWYMRKIGRNPSLSTSENDSDNQGIEDFKSGKTDVLIVVNKGILGFNDSNITLLIDLRSSSNIDTSYQLFARVLRVHPKKVRKAYYRIGKNGFDYNKQVIILHKMKSLIDRDIFKGYNGKNLKVEVY